MYALCDRGSLAMQVNRFVIGDASKGVSDDTIVPFLCDGFVSSMEQDPKVDTSFFVNYSKNYRHFFTDGMKFMCFATCLNDSEASLCLLPPGMRSGLRRIAGGSRIFGVATRERAKLDGILRDSTSGSLLFYGDFGVRVSE